MTQPGKRSLTTLTTSSNCSRIRRRIPDCPSSSTEFSAFPRSPLSKRIVDQDNRRGHFVLTGSSDIFTTGTYDSLAGRVTTLMLRPFSADELHYTALSNETSRRFILSGNPTPYGG